MRNTARTQPYAPALDRDRGLRILLAEDNRQLRTLLAMTMYNDGHFVDEFSNGRELVEHLATRVTEDRELDVDVVIVEQELPAISGLTVLAALRARSPSMAFVLMTANEAVQARARELGAAILDQPFDVGAIREAIQRALAMAEVERSEAAHPPDVVNVVVQRCGSA